MHILNSFEFKIPGPSRNNLIFPTETSVIDSTDRAIFAPSAIDSSTFTSNMSLPVHRWFRYSAGFSASWVRHCISSAKSRQDDVVRVLDPFAGSGTVLLEAEEADVASYGLESHPFVSRVARAKITSGVEAEAEGFRRFAAGVLKRAEKVAPDVGSYSSLIHKCYPDDVLERLDQLRKAWVEAQDHPLSELGWLALASILRQCSPVGTANWQYILPTKTKTRVVEPFTAFNDKVRQMDMDIRGRRPTEAVARLIQGDAREMPGVPDKWATLVITSPPYPNNFDYADATRLEMTFFGDVAGWGDLQKTVREHLVRSCTQHVSPLVSETSSLLADKLLDPIRAEIDMVCGSLEKERHLHGGKKNYHTMIVAYFLDMARMWRRLREVTTDGASVCFVIGDSAPYGIHVPVDQWMGELAVASGFKGFTFQKTRDRNMKWKNRKHRVPLREGHLLVEG
jgi:hypothetical protein